jgi:Zn-dependent protease
MEPSTSGSFRLFRLAGIDVFLHWSWFAVAVVQIVLRPNVYEAPAWKVAEYLSLFGIVLMHEFGHALACRSVGGRAERIVLWPLGGIAYVAPPPRPGPVLWSIAAGPLVNFALAPLLLTLLWLASAAGWPRTHHDPFEYLSTVTLINVGLLALNLLPIYPLDGGQILHALLWFFVGRWRGLLIVSVGGGVCGVLLIGASCVLALVLGPAAFVLGLLAAFVALRSFFAFQASRAMLRLERLPRHGHCACPNCGESAPAGEFWQCGHCGTKFDTFVTRGRCPGCGAWYLETACPHCQASNHVDGWYRPEGGEGETTASPEGQKNTSDP